MSRQFSRHGSTPNGYLPPTNFYKIETPCSLFISGQSHCFSRNLPADNLHLQADNLHPHHNTTGKNIQSCNRIKESLEMPHPSVFRCYPSERNCIPRKVFSRESLKTDRNNNQKENRKNEVTGNVDNLISIKKKSTQGTRYNKPSHIKFDCASRQKVPSRKNVTHIIALNSRVTSKCPSKVLSNNVTNELTTFLKITKSDESVELLDITTITDDTSLWSDDAETEFTNDRPPKEFNYLPDSFPRSLSNEYANKKMSSTVKTLIDKPFRDEVDIKHENAEKCEGIKEFDNKSCANLKAEKSDKSASCITLKLTHAEIEKTSQEIRNKNIRIFNNNLNSLATNHPQITSSDNKIQAYRISFKTQKTKMKCCQHFCISPRKKERLSKKLISFAKMWRGKRGMEIKQLAEF